MKALGSHPNVVRIIDVFEDYESIYIVQEWIQGQTLMKFFRDSDKDEGLV